MLKRTDQSLDYVTKDYEGFRRLMMDLIPIKTPEWTDCSESDFGIVLLELLAHGLDVLSFYQDKSFNEAMISTAKHRRSILAICRMLGYELTQQIPARHMIKVTKSADYKDDVIRIPKGTKVSTDTKIGEPVIFELDNDLILKAGTLEGEVAVTQGETITREVVGVGSGLANQRLKLGNPDVLGDTLAVFTTLKGKSTGSTANSQDIYYWNQIDSFLTSSPQDKHYKLEIDEFNNSFLVFGNGVSGSTVSRDFNVNASYRSGGGVIGNVGLNTINTLPETDIAGIAKITNDKPPIQIGRDSESLEHARDSAPRHYRLMERAITKQDFEDICKIQSGVALVKVVETFNLKGEVDIYIVPDDYSDKVPESLKTELLDKINSKKLLKDTPIIKDPTYLDFNIEVEILVYPNYSNSDIKDKVTSQLTEAFKIQNMTYDEEVLIANIYMECLKVAGVKNIKVIEPKADIEVYDKSKNIPRVARLKTVKVTAKGGVEV